MLVFKLFLLASICSLAQPPLIEYGRGMDIIILFNLTVKSLDVAVGKLDTSLVRPVDERELIRETLDVEELYSTIIVIQEDAKLFSSMLRARTNNLYKSKTILLAQHRENLELATSLERISTRQFSHVEQKILKAADKVRKLGKKSPVRTRSACSGFSLFCEFCGHPEKPFVVT